MLAKVPFRAAGRAISAPSFGGACHHPHGHCWPCPNLRSSHIPQPPCPGSSTVRTRRSPGRFTGAPTSGTLPAPNPAATQTQPFLTGPAQCGSSPCVVRMGVHETPSGTRDTPHRKIKSIQHRRSVAYFPALEPARGFQRVWQSAEHAPRSRRERRGASRQVWGITRTTRPSLR